MVIANSIGAVGPMPRAAEAEATNSSPAMAVPRAPRRAISSDPGIAAIANSSTGNPESAPIARSLRANCRWINGRTGGTANTVRRRSAPASHNTARRNSDEGCAAVFVPDTRCIAAARKIARRYGRSQAKYATFSPLSRKRGTRS